MSLEDVKLEDCGGARLLALSSSLRRERSRSSCPSFHTLEQWCYQFALADCIIDLLNLLAWGHGSQAGQKLGAKLRSDKLVERVCSAVLDPVAHWRDSLVVISITHQG